LEQDKISYILFNIILSCPLGRKTGHQVQSSEKRWNWNQIAWWSRRVD